LKTKNIIYKKEKHYGRNLGRFLRKRRERMKRFFEKNKEKILNFELDGLDFSD